MEGCADRSFDIFEIAPLVSYFKRTKPDIVNCHGCLSARIAAFLARVPVRIYTRHCAFEVRPGMTRFPLKSINKIATRLLNTKIIAVAYAARQNLTDMGIDERQIEVIINGVEPVEKYSAEQKMAARRKLSVPEDAFVYGISARLEECKGIDTLLRAARVLINNGINCYFLILGKGSRESELKSLVNSLGITDKVKFCGFVSDVTPYINCFDVNVNCSRGTETSSLALSEGMSIALPCVASDFGGNPYMVRDGYNGFIYKTDDFFALAECLTRLYSDRELYKKMSENSLARYIEELSAKNMARKTEELYSSLFLATRDYQKRSADAIAK
jgi:glycosyltransferase involved in cell wall biosynthesis